jgi:hypothetical protein
MQGRNGLYLAITSITVALGLSVWLHAPGSSPQIYSDVIDSFWSRQWLQAGSFPYTTQYFEYPALSGLLIYATKVIGSTLTGYYETFSAFSFVAGAVIAWSCWSIVKKSGKSLVPFYFMLPTFIIYGVYNFDLFHAVFVMLSLQALVYNRRGFSAFFLAVAVSTKLASVVLLPLFILEARDWRSRLSYLGIFAVVVAIINVPFAVMNFNSFLAGYQFIGNWGLEDAWYVWIFQNPNTWTIAKIFGLGVAALLLLRVYTMKGELLPKTFLALAAYLLGTYIYAPQFNLLLLPVIAVLDLQSPSLFLWDGFNALIILTWFIPGSSPTLAGNWPQVFALLRAACLVWLSLSLAVREGYGLPRFVYSLFGRPAKTASMPGLAAS